MDAPTVYTATTEEPYGRQDWASLDGEDWLPVNRPATQEDAADIAAMFDGDDTGRLLVRFARRWLQMRDATFG